MTTPNAGDSANRAAQFDWNDLRFFLAVARTGTSLGAASELGTSQPTVVRRIAALEQAAGVTLFERSPAGYALTEAGQAILPIAERAGSGLQAVADMFACRRAESQGRIRLTVPQAVDDMLLPVVRRFHGEWPNVQVQIIASDRHFDLARGEADMALRAGPFVEDPSLLARALPTIAWTVYGASDPVAGTEIPGSVEALAGRPLIGGEGLLARIPAFQWLSGIASGGEFVLRCNSLVGVQSAIRMGIGYSVLPCLLGGADPALAACLPPIEGISVPFWLIVRRELRRLPPVQALFERISAHLDAQAPQIAGAR